MDDAGLPALAEAIQHMHGCEARWLRSVPVRETHEGRAVWVGEVQVFALEGHPTAARCYAWSHATEGERRRFYAVLHLPPVDSPRAAVQASIVADARKK